MGLADAIDAQRRKPAGRVLKIDRIRDTLDDDDRAVLDAALRDLALPVPRLAEALRQEGHDISDAAIYAYRRAHVVA